MQHQLVLQFRRTDLGNEDEIVALETALRAVLGNSAEFDGHDIGSRDVNLFILALDPSSVFRRSKLTLESLKLLDNVTAAHRVVGGSEFKVIWPLRVRRKFRIG